MVNVEKDTGNAMEKDKCFLQQMVNVRFRFWIVALVIAYSPERWSEFQGNVGWYVITKKNENQGKLERQKTEIER